jgi:hypothetical protein
MTSKVGNGVFKSDHWQRSVTKDNHNSTTRRTTHCTTDALGGTLSEEVKVAVMLHLMAGASFLDLILIYGISHASVYSIFHKCSN